MKPTTQKFFAELNEYSVSRQAEELNDKLSNVLGKDLFVVTREIKNQFS